MRTYGWYEYDDAPWRMRNTQTKQEIQILEISKESDPAKFFKGWDHIEKEKGIKLCQVGGNTDEISHSLEIKLLYKDDEIQQPLHITIVHHKDRQKKLHSGENAITLGGMHIIVNYNISFPSNPEYNTWLRIDDFLMDALLCWPDAIFEGRHEVLISIGAWQQGKWNPRMKRVFSDRRDYPLEKSKNIPIADASLTPLNCITPSKWRYMDSGVPYKNIELNFLVDETYGVLHYDQKSPIDRFQNQVPYIYREDQKAFFFLTKVVPGSHRGEDPMTYVHYTYVDEDIFLTFSSAPSYGLQIHHCNNFGFRKLPPSQEFWASDLYGKIKAPPYFEREKPQPIYWLSHGIWKRVVHAISEAWPAWKDSIQDGERKKLEIDQSVQLPPYYGRTAFAGNYGPKIQGGFIGGLASGWYSIRFEEF